MHKSWKGAIIIFDQFRDWLTVKFCPPIEIVLDLVIDGFTVTRKVTVPAPLIKLGVKTCIQLTLLVTK